MIYLLSPLKKEGTISLPMISFELVAKEIDFSSCDTLMFTSKQAVVSTNAIDKRWREYPCIAIGGATKKKIEELGGRVIYAPKAGMVNYQRGFDGKKKGVGAQISAWDNVVATLPNLSAMNSKTYVNEIDISKVAKGQDAEIEVDA